ncbi:MAG: O-antigen ligase family protein [Candidatus Omnitrophica bacterium]|nr:O-antigen ligase family protein [Candidatus Omnitrophota bacterium]MBU4333603.1 O-antigen ligase family protein [Candidatus Omnitrophota bacterium]
MIKETIIRRCDKTAFVSICALIYFLPISIALVEWFVALPVLCFCIKKLTEILFRVFDVIKNKERNDKIRYCLKALLPVNNILTVSAMAYVLICFLSIFVSSYPQLSTRAFFGKILERVFLFFVFVESVNTEKRIKRFSLVLFVSVGLICINGFYQSIFTQGFIRGFSMMEGRLTSTFKHPNDFATYLIIPIFIVFNFLLSDVFLSQKKARLKSRNASLIRYAFMLLFAICILNLALTFSRGAYIGALVALLFMWFSKYCKLKVVLVSAALFLIGFSPLMAKMRNVSLISDSVHKEAIVPEKNKTEEEKRSELLTMGMGRIGFWKEALTSISRKPILGTGVNTYSKEAQKRGNWTGYYAHNCYLQMAAEIGLVGLASFLWMLFVLFKRACDKSISIKDRYLLILFQGALSGLVGFLVHAFFDTGFYSLQLNTLFWVFLGLVVSIMQVDKTALKREI